MHRAYLKHNTISSCQCHRVSTSYYYKVVVEFVVASLTYRLNSQVVNCVSMEIMAVSNDIP